MINKDNYELYFFQYQEGMLSDEMRREVEAFAALNPHLAEELTLYAEAPRLTAGDATFSDKDSLRRRTPILWWRYAAAAAVVTAVAVGGMRWMLQPSPLSPVTVAEKESSIDSSSPLLSEPQQQDSITLPAPQTLPQPSAILLAEANLPPAEEEPSTIAHQEWEPTEDPLADHHTLAVEAPMEQFLACNTPQEEEPIMQRETQQIKSTHIVYNQSDITLNELAADKIAERYPIQTIQFVSLSVKTVSTFEKVRNHPIVRFIRSI